MASDHFRYEYGEDVQKLERMLDQVPQEYWL